MASPSSAPSMAACSCSRAPSSNLKRSCGPCVASKCLRVLWGMTCRTCILASLHEASRAPCVRMSSEVLEKSMGTRMLLSVFIMVFVSGVFPDRGEVNHRLQQPVLQPKYDAQSPRSSTVKRSQHPHVHGRVRQYPLPPMETMVAARNEREAGPGSPGFDMGAIQPGNRAPPFVFQAP